MRSGKTSRVSTLPKPSSEKKIPQLVSRELDASLEKTDIQITPQTFMDLYQFQGKAKQSVSLTLKSDEFNPVLQLFFVDQSGPKPKYISVAKNDDRGPADFTAQLNLSLLQNGLYYIGVTTSDRGEQGRYQIQAKGI
ncbi:pre-peptidase C-terminal domain-containing protein [Acaryochloris sp. CCMEE 5410]|uniref:pre-peptidase C-terminal domain-containing protein n=1 Tax=Acaryochloris sp. CCMEE 5410 TaxID=310037 RepID=UPI0021CEA4AE|nr:pre-peptidase C-terminal domain-containing protein [Acaryochloris sp. CCMEE 5410]KAI9132067.1 pre-peptidase C-terminal domain-containing protein [Acaryochloris sp. CCMEE 5410]